jgi:hypothetical protein
MGVTWWAYGNIGMLGEPPRWEVKEVVYPGLGEAGLDEARILDTSGLPDPKALNTLEGDAYEQERARLEPTLAGWELLPESNPSFGEAKATVDEYFIEHPEETLGLKAAADYITSFSFERGGKDDLPSSPSRLDRLELKLKNTFWQIQHPPHYAIIQVQPVLPQEPVPGERPPTPVADPSKPVVSVIMERNLGDVRFPAAMLTIFSGGMFAATILMLHRRDLQVAQVRGLLPAPAEG